MGAGSTTGTLGTNTGAIANNGTLAYNLSSNVTVANLISGTGGLSQLGTGTVILTGANTYGGATIIGSGSNAGTLQVGNGGSDGSLGASTSVVNNGTLAFNLTTTPTVSAAISGSGGLSQLGSGTTVLTGNNSYGGTTTISAGTLQVGNGGSTGSLGTSSSIVNNSALVVNLSSTTTISGVISGSGTLTQSGSGTTILTGTNTYKGATNISGGTLQVGASSTSGTTGSLGTSAVTLSNGARLSYQLATNTTINNAISGAGSVIANITGTLNIGTSGIALVSGDSSVKPAISLTSTGALTIAGPLSVTNASSTDTSIALTTTTSGSGISLGSIDGSNTGSGVVNVTVQANGGAITTSDISAYNITLDNTNGTINSATGAITQGTAASTGIGISIGGDITATNNLNFAGASSANTGVSQSANISGANIQGFGNSVATIGGKNGYYQTSGNITTTGASGASVITGKMASAGGGGTGALYITGSSNLTAASGTTLTLVGQATAQASDSFGNTRGLRIDPGVTINTSGVVALQGNSNSDDGLYNFATINVKTGSLALTGTSTGSGGGSQSGLTSTGAINLYNNTSLSIVGSVANQAATSAETGVVIQGAIGQAAGQTTAGNISITGYSTSASNSTAVTTTSSVTTETGNITIVGQALAGSGGSTLSIGGSVTSTLGNVTVQSIGGAISHTAGTISGNNVTIDNTGAGLTSLIADSYDSNVLSVGTALGGLIDSTTGAITAGSAYNYRGNGLAGILLSGSGIMASGNVNIQGNVKSSAADYPGVALSEGISTSGSTSVVNISSNTLVRLNGTIEDTSGTIGTVTVTGNTGVVLGSNITSAGSGGITVTAGSGASSTAALIATNGATLTQASGSGNISQFTTGSGDLTTAKVVDEGSGNVIIAAGTDLAVGTTTGNVLTTNSGNTVTLAGTDKLYVYSGSEATTGNLSSLSSGLSSLYVAGSGFTTNAQIGTAYGASTTIANGASTQVLFRDSTSPNFALTLTSLTKQYGSDDPTLSLASVTAAYTGGNLTYTPTGGNNTFVLASTTALNSLTGLTTATRTSGEDVGTYSYSGVSSSLSTLTFTAAPSLKITPKALTITANEVSDVTYDGVTSYQGLVSQAGVSTTGLVNATVNGVVIADRVASVISSFSSGLTVGVGTAIDGTGVAQAGDFNRSISAASGTGLSNYTITYVGNTGTVDKANLSLSGSQVYTADTAFAGTNLTAKGVAGETFAVTGTGAGTNLLSANVQTGATLNSVTGLALGTSSNGGVASNYNPLSTTGSSVNVTPAALTITGATTSTVYNADEQTNTYTVKGLLGNDSVNRVTGLAAGVNVGTTTDSLGSASGNGLSNYTISYVNGSQTITAAPLVITGATTNATYSGSAQSNSGFTQVGLKGSDTIASVSGFGTGTTVGTYNDNLSGAVGTGLSNYNISYQNGSITVGKANLTITANNTANFVTLADPAGYSGVSVEGLVGADTVASATLSRVAGTTAGNYALSASNAVGTGLSNYNINYVAGTYTIVPAQELLINTTGATTTYGSAATIATPTASYYNASGKLINALLQAKTTNAQGLTTYTFNDEAGGTVSFSLAANIPTTAVSGSGNTVVGSYGIVANNFSKTSSNLVANAAVVTGDVTFNPLALTVTAANTTTVYNASAQGQSYSVSTGLNAKDAVTISGTATRTNVGTSASSLLASGSDAGNYSFTFVNGDLTVTPAPLTVTGANTTGVYTSNSQTNTYSTTGLLGSDTVTGVSGVAARTNVGTTADNLNSATGSGLSNYDITYVNGGQTITPAALKITGATTSSTYTSNLQTNSYSQIGLLGSDSITSVTGLASHTNVGTATDNLTDATGTGLSNYTITFVNGSHQITPANATVTGATTSATYTANAQTNTYTVSGLLGSDTVTEVSGVATRTNVGTTADNLSVVAGTGISNYNFSYINGSQTITKASLTITGDTTQSTYTSNLQTNGYSVTGLLGSDSVTTVTGSASATNVSKTSDNLTAATGSGLSNYSINFVNGSLQITPASLTIAGDTTSSTYTANAQTNSYTVSGLLGKTDAVTGVTGLASRTTVGTTSDNLSGAVGSGLSNYMISYVNGSQTITAAPLTITGDSTSVTYTSTAQTNTYKVAGLLGSDAVSSVTGSATRTNVGSSQDDLAGALGTGLSNYTISYVNGSLAVTPATLTITGDTTSSTYTSNAQTNTYTKKGLLGTDSVTSVDGLAQITNVGTTADHLSNAEGNGLSNYTITYVNGSKSITPAALTITGDTTTTGYSGLVQTNTYGVSGLLGTDSVTSVAGLASGTNVGKVSDVLSGATGSGLSNYTISYLNGSQTITPADLTITGSTTNATYNGYAQSNNGFTVSGLKGADTVTAVSGFGSGTNVGTYRDTLTGATGSGLSNYNITYNSGSLTIGAANLTITANNSSNFVTQSDPSGYAGVSVVGLLGPNDAVTSANLTRVAGTAAGSYVLTASGATGTGLSNYNISYVGGTYTIVPAGELMVNTAGAVTTYGTAAKISSPAATYLSSTGTIITELASSTTTTSAGVTIYNFSDGAGGTVSFSLSANVPTTAFSKSGNVAVGTYGIIASNFTKTGSNLTTDAAVVTGDVVVNPLAVTVTAGNTSNVYTSQTQQQTYTAQGLISGDAITVSGTASRTNVGTSTSALSVSGADSSNYSFTLVNGDLTVTPAALTITGAKTVSTYTSQSQTNTYSTSGLLGNDRVSGVSGSASRTDVGTTTDALSDATGTGLSNYSISYVNGSQTITPAALTIKGASTTAVYTSNEQTNTYTTAGLLGSDTVADVAGLASHTNVGTVSDSLSGATGSGLSNYTITYLNGSHTITPAVLTVKGDTTSVTYTGLSQSNTYSVSGLLGSDSVTNVVGAATGTNVGKTTDALSGAAGSGLSNYNISYVNGSQTITPANLTIAGDNTVSTYTGGAQTNTYAVTGLLASDTVSSVTGSAVRTTVGQTYDVLSAATGSGLSNYNITYVNGSQTVTPAALTITGATSTSTYTASAQTNTYSTTGLLGTDSVNSVKGLASRTNVGTSADDLSTASGSGLSNYQITYVNGSHTVTAASLIITGATATATYDANQQTNTYAASGLLGKDTVSGVTGLATQTNVGTATDSLSNAVGTGLSNYNISYVNGSLKINPADLTITGATTSSTYTSQAQTNTYSVSGLMGADTVSGVTGLATRTTVGTTQDALSAATGAGLTNYTITYVNGSQTITPAALTITGADTSSVYTAKAQTNTYTTNGLLGADTVTAVLGSATHTNVGSVDDSLHSASGSGLSNYHVTYVNGSHTITAAPLTITGDITSSTYTSDTQTNTYKTAGLLGNDAVTGVKGLATGTTVGQTVDHLYEASGTGVSNYDIKYVNGSLTVTPASLTVSNTANNTTYNGALQTNSGFTVTGLKGADTVDSVTGFGAGTNVGTYADGLSVASGKGLSNYNITYQNGSITIGQANLKITANDAADFVTQTKSGVSSYAGVSVEGLLGTNDTVTSTTITGSMSSNAPAGYYANALTASNATGTGLSNYNITYVAGNYTVVPAGELLVSTTGATTTYGTAASIATPTAKYLTSTGTVINELLQSVTTNAAGLTTYTFSDQSGGTVAFSLTPNITSYSKSGNAAVGTYGLSASNFVKTGSNLTANFAAVTGEVTVDPLATTITATPTTSVYNAGTQTQAYTVSNLISGDAVSISGVASRTNIGTAESILSASGVDVGNYTVTYLNHDLTVTPAPLTVTGASTYVTYNGGTQSNSGFTTAGLLGSDKVASVSGFGTGTNPGIYADALFGANGSGLSNYTIRYVNGFLYIGAAEPGKPVVTPASAAVVPTSSKASPVASVTAAVPSTVSTASTKSSATATLTVFNPVTPIVVPQTVSRQSSLSVGIKDSGEFQAVNLPSIDSTVCDSDGSSSAALSGGAGQGVVCYSADVPDKKSR